MGIPNQKGNRLKRLENKTLDAQFLHEIQEGMNCSPFESEAVLEIVKEIYFRSWMNLPLQHLLEG